MAILGRLEPLMLHWLEPHDRERALAPVLEVDHLGPFTMPSLEPNVDHMTEKGYGHQKLVVSLEPFTMPCLEPRQQEGKRVRGGRLEQQIMSQRSPRTQRINSMGVGAN